MPSKSAKLALFLLCVSLALSVPQLLARKKDKAPEPAASEQKRAVQALNRLTFGPRPGDVQRVMALGVDRDVIRTESCNGCHYQLAAHGGP